VTVDLNGFTIDGADAGDAVGVDISSRRDVSIENGKVRDFATGVGITDSARVRLSRLTLVEVSHFGILSVRSNRGRIERIEAFHTTADHGNAAILLFQSDHNSLVHNTLRRNGDGINLVQSGYNTIARNVSSDSGAGIGLVDHSIRIESHATSRTPILTPAFCLTDMTTTTSSNGTGPSGMGSPVWRSGLLTIAS
jgi:parallel beta-helix repeat protein